MTRKEYAESRRDHYHGLIMFSKPGTCASESYWAQWWSWVSFLKFHDYMKGTQ